MTLSSRITQRIVSVTRTVPDLALAQRFYGDALGFAAAESAAEVSREDLHLLGLDAGRGARLELHLGRQHLTLLQFTPQGKPYPAGSTASDLWFQHCAIVVGDMAHAHAQVIQAGASPITEDGPQHLPANTGGVTAFKFRDPFGHPWELLALPRDVGAPVWQDTSPSLMRGIDHTAIAVSSLDASRRFYADILGFRADGQTHNTGPAQTRLDAVPDDDVDVLALNPEQAPPHLELLAYRVGTRRRRGSVAPADSVVTRTIASGDIDAIADRVSPDAQLHHGTWTGKPAIAFEDPDGHRWIYVAA